MGGIGVPVVVGLSLHPGFGDAEELASLLLSGGSGQVPEGLARFEPGADRERRHGRGPGELVQSGGCPACCVRVSQEVGRAPGDDVGGGAFPGRLARQVFRHG